MSPSARASLLALLLLSVACSRAPKDLRVWRPSDHDRTEENQNAQAGPASSGSPDLSQPAKMLGVDQVVLVTWRQNCTRCHGMLGRGDGPQGAMFGARDLSDPAWQSSVSDAQIATAITKGKGRMPSFNLPAATVTGLVRLVRMMNANRGAGPEEPTPPGNSAAPAGSAAPDSSASPTRPARVKRAHPPPAKNKPDPGSR